MGRVVRTGRTLTPGYLGATWRRQVRDCAPAAYGPCAIRTASKFVTAQQGRGLAELPDFGTAVFRRRPIAPQQGIASIGWPRGFRSTNDRISAGMKFGTTEILTRSRTSPRRPSENSRIRVAMLFRWSSTSRAMATRLGPAADGAKPLLVRTSNCVPSASSSSLSRRLTTAAATCSRAAALVDGVVLDDSHELLQRKRIQLQNDHRCPIEKKHRKSAGHRLSDETRQAPHESWHSIESKP